MRDHVDNSKNGVDRRTQIVPGSYHFRFSQFMPWMTVKVFLESVAKPNTCVKIAGFQLDADKLFKLGYWKSA
jgi:hypothetical protein